MSGATRRTRAAGRRSPRCVARRRRLRQRHDGLREQPAPAVADRRHARRSQPTSVSVSPQRFGAGPISLDRRQPDRRLAAGDARVGRARQTSRAQAGRPGRSTRATPRRSRPTSTRARTRVRVDGDGIERRRRSRRRASARARRTSCCSRSAARGRRATIGAMRRPVVTPRSPASRSRAPAPRPARRRADAVAGALQQTAAQRREDDERGQAAAAQRRRLRRARRRRSPTSPATGRPTRVVLVRTGGAAGAVALYALQHHGAERPTTLRAVFRCQSLYRATTQIARRDARRCARRDCARATTSAAPRRSRERAYAWDARRRRTLVRRDVRDDPGARRPGAARPRRPSARCAARASTDRTTVANPCACAILAYMQATNRRTPASAAPPSSPPAARRSGATSCAGGEQATVRALRGARPLAHPDQGARTCSTAPRS